MTDGVQRAMTRHVRCAWETYAVKELGMSAGDSLRAFDNWVESLAEARTVGEQRSRAPDAACPPPLA